MIAKLAVILKMKNGKQILAIERKNLSEQNRLEKVYKDPPPPPSSDRTG